MAGGRRDARVVDYLSLFVYLTRLLGSSRASVQTNSHRFGLTALAESADDQDCHRTVER